MNTNEELAWFKSSYSGGAGGECLEVATRPHAIHIRDSKQPPTDADHLTVTPRSWAAFVAYARVTPVP
ncbi:DUF397 domain-containing protein [Streptomyces sp. TRM66268-LWL]|uniref:DUF397 domain-containing protein n=1 Tax=Streptomyces polyasparticus TaxID=2767826 RepID=A0ABR7SKZ3_9ACTN|nr:DUF397 domain-containing protein [Streptomyces polyasparticus]MBC9716088.1 DUF397 domain-containing protein [Streptomyces polyasparticus]